MNEGFKRILAVSAALIFSASVSAFAKERVTVKGSTTVLPITQKAAEKFMKKNKDISITIEGSGSGNGIKALLDGSTDIANASRQMKSKELDAAKEKGMKVKEITVAYDMIVPIIHKSNKVKNLTIDQLKAIYKGEIKNWKEVGGSDENIVVVSRDTSSGTYEVWHEKVMHKQDVTPRALLQASNGAVLTTVSKNPKALGYVGFGYLNKTVNKINVNNVVPTVKNGKTGKYPISRGLYMYVNENNYSKPTAKFVKYLLSGTGQKMVKQAGFIPR